MDIFFISRTDFFKIILELVNNLDAKLLARRQANLAEVVFSYTLYIYAIFKSFGISSPRKPLSPSIS